MRRKNCITAWIDRKIEGKSHTSHSQLHQRVNQSDLSACYWGEHLARVSVTLLISSARARGAGGCVAAERSRAPPLQLSVLRHRNRQNNRTSRNHGTMWGAAEATSILSDFAASRVGLFPVKMATGAGWQPPYNTSTSSTKYPPCTTSSMLYDGSLTLEYTQDLHLKMSKKIAQLTKVRGREWVKLRGVVQSFRACKWSVTV